jgi:ATP-dependent helicase STH1/SNF2
VYVEGIDARKEKDEARAEIRRLQALKENDMEAYTNLVQETKNGRLKFLLNETDSYISTINRMIQEQRVEANGEEGEAEALAQAEAEAEGESTPRGTVSKNYYNETHRTVETVVQPTMMRNGDLKVGGMFMCVWWRGWRPYALCKCYAICYVLYIKPPPSQ